MRENFSRHSPPGTFMFIGRSGCGKGTQLKLLKEFLNKATGLQVFQVASGETFRKMVDAPGYTNSKAKETDVRGGLQPEFLSIWVWSDILVKNFQDPNQHLFFDGTVRRAHEAPVLDSALDFYERNQRFVIYLNVSRAWAKERLLARNGGRADDREEYIENRLNWFETDVLPVLSYFKSNPKYKFLDINGEQKIEKVHADILGGLGHPA